MGRAAAVVQREVPVVRAEGATPLCPPCEPDVEAWRDNNGTICAWGYVSGGYAWVDLLGVARYRLDSHNRQVMAFAAPDVDVNLIRDSYHHAALPIAIQYFGGEALHASAVLTRQGVVGFCAVSETGKSTIAAALSLRGHSLWADDAVALETVGDGTAIETIPLPFKLRLHSATRAYLGNAADHCVTAHLDCGSALTPLAALCVLKRATESKSRVEIRHLGSAEAFGALLPHAFCFSVKDTERKRLMLERYLGLAARTPIFSVSFPPGFEHLPSVLDAIEKAVPAFAPL